MTRKILHVDMDAFYASVEQRDDPGLAGCPVIVGAPPERRGVVAAASYEVRAFGVHSAMPSAQARRLCPDAVFVAPRFDVYRAVSRQIQAIFHSITWRVEPLALDEAYLDVTDVRQYRGSATRMARAIKRRIAAETGLTASAGVSYNKLLAKLASTMHKPDGLTVILPGEGEALLAGLPVSRLPGVGPATEARLQRLGIATGADLAAAAPESLAALGRHGRRLQQLARGIDEREVSPHRERKSIGAETTFATDLLGIAAITAAAAPLVDKVAGHLRRRRLTARTVVLKLRYADFETISRRRSLVAPTADAAALATVFTGLLARTAADRRPVRLVGITAAGLQADAGNRQARLFGD